MGALGRVAVAEVISRGSIKDSDVLRLHYALEKDAQLGQEEAERLLALNGSCPIQAPLWREFFIPVLTEHVVHQLPPDGYVTADKAKWLISQISKGGRVATKTELDLLLAVLDRARWVPGTLVAFALAQVRDAVLGGDGPLRGGDSRVRGMITTREVDLVRTVLCRFGASGAVPITRTEAELLFEINDALTGGAVSPAWADLFVKAVANLLMAAGGYAVPSREIALQRDGQAEGRPYLSSRGAMRGAIQRSLATVRGTYRPQRDEERAVSRLERQRIEIVTNEPVTLCDARWLAGRLLGRASLSPLEEALLAYMYRESLIAGPLLSLARKRDGKAA
jgi:hypothetical protein